MDLESVSSEFVTREFLAVVLAGFGDGLAPLTSNHGDEPCPKSLLPVANKPLLEYTLTWLEQSGIKDVLLICPASHRSSIYHHIHSDVSSSSLRIDLQTYDEDESGTIGTCGLLRQFSNRISEDFVVVPCDFIPPPSLPLTSLLNKFRVEALSEQCLATTCWYTPQALEKGAFQEEWGPPPTSFPIVWDPSSGTLLHIATPDDQDRNPDEIELRASLLSQFPHTRLSSALEDSHIYVCRRTVLDLLHAKLHFSSLREEFFPWLCTIQYQLPKRIKYGQALKPTAKASSQTLSLQHSSLLARISNLEDEQNDTNSLAFPGESDLENLSDTGLTVGIIVHGQSDPGVRVNTLQKFYEINKRMLVNTTYSLPVDPKDRSLIDQRAQISVDSIVGESTQISERTTIKRSVIGRHCVIGRMVKINACVLLDHCVIEDGAKLDGCLLGKNTQIGPKAELTRCVTQAGYEVNAGEIVKGEKLEVSDWMATPDLSATQEETDSE